jgi:hypothetical protein
MIFLLGSKYNYRSTEPINGTAKNKKATEKIRGLVKVVTAKN